MNIFLEDHELEEIKPIEDGDDRGLVISPMTGSKGEVRQEISEINKEIIAIDSIETTARKAAALHGVGKTNANRYANGKDVEPETRGRILSVKHNIQDVAIAKLMDTLNLIDPENVEKERDRIAIATGLSSVIEKMSDRAANGSDKPAVHLHLYSPNQKVEKDYDVIDV